MSQYRIEKVSMTHYEYCVLGKTWILRSRCSPMRIAKAALGTVLSSRELCLRTKLCVSFSVWREKSSHKKRCRPSPGVGVMPNNLVGYGRLQRQRL